MLLWCGDQINKQMWLYRQTDEFNYCQHESVYVMITAYTKIATAPVIAGIPGFP